MKRFVLAAMLAAVIGSSAFAQPPFPVPGQVPAPPPTAVPVPHPDPVPPAPTYNGPPGPAIPYHKSGGMVVGTNGYYPYDTGLYLLAETGVSRQAGYFTMVYPGGAGPAVGAPATRGGHFKHFFHR